MTGRRFAPQWSEIFIFCREYPSLAWLYCVVRELVVQCLSTEDVRNLRDGVRPPGHHDGLQAAPQPPRHLRPGPGGQSAVRSDGLWGAVYGHLQTEGLPLRLVPQETQLEWNISKYGRQSKEEREGL